MPFSLNDQLPKAPAPPKPAPRRTVKPGHDEPTALRAYLNSLDVEARKDVRSRIAEACGIQPTAMYNWEKGTQPIPAEKVKVVAFFTGLDREVLDPRIFGAWKPGEPV